jgi:hypothetical protein
MPVTASAALIMADNCEYLDCLHKPFVEDIIVSDESMSCNYATFAALIEHDASSSNDIVRSAFSTNSSSRKRFSSCISLDSVALDGDDDSVIGDDLPLISPERAYKKTRFSKKVVHFADSSAGTQLVQTQLIQPLHGSDDIMNVLFWSRKELNKIQMEAKFMLATDADIQDYVELFQRTQAKVMKSTSIDVLSLNDESLFLLNGLKDGLRGLECLAASYHSRRREVCKIVHAIVAAQHDAALPELAVSLSAPSVAWAMTLGVAESQATDPN